MLVLVYLMIGMSSVVDNNCGVQAIIIAICLLQLLHRTCLQALQRGAAAPLGPSSVNQRLAQLPMHLWPLPAVLKAPVTSTGFSSPMEMLAGRT